MKYPGKAWWSLSRILNTDITDRGDKVSHGIEHDPKYLLALNFSKVAHKLIDILPNLIIQEKMKINLG